MQKCPCGTGFPWRHLPCYMEKSRFCLWTCSSVSSFSGNFFRISCLSGRNFGRDFPARRRKMVAGFIFFVFRLAQNWSYLENFCLSDGIKLAFLAKFLSSCWQKMSILGKFSSFGWHKTGRFWEIFVLLLAKNGGSREILSFGWYKTGRFWEQTRKIRDFFGGQERTFSGFSFRSLKKNVLDCG